MLCSEMNCGGCVRTAELWKNTNEVMRLKIGELFLCQRCFTPTACKNPMQKYCSDCSYEVSKQRKSKRGVVIGEEFACESCGKLIVRTSGNQSYCETCSTYKKSAQLKEYAERNGHKKEPPKVIAKPDYTLTEVCAAARKHNMTYGKYVAAWHEGLVDSPETITKKKRGRKKAVKE